MDTNKIKSPSSLIFAYNDFFYVKYWWIPNALTISRIMIIPILTICFYLSFRKLCVIICLYQGFTDLLDGILARKFKFERNKMKLIDSYTESRISLIGAWVDQISDKVTVCINFILIIEKFKSFVITLPILLLFGREILVSGLRELFASYHLFKIQNKKNSEYNLPESNTVPVSLLGKIKATFQYLSLIIMFYVDYNTKNDVYLTYIGIFLIYTSCIISLLSGFNYGINVFELIKS